MNTKRFALALFFGVTVAMGASLISKRLDSSKDLVTQEVVVVARPVARGATLTKEMLSMQTLPAEGVPNGAITDISLAEDRVVAISVQEGILLTGHLASKEKKGVRALLDEGLRAFTIHTPDLASGVAGLIRPGDHVDVLLTVTSRQSDDPAGGAETVTLLQDIEILAVDQNLTDQPPLESSSKRPGQSKAAVQSVTLMATPEQTVKLSLAQSQGTLHLSLRHPQVSDADPEASMAAGPAVTFNELLGREPEEKPAVQPVTNTGTVENNTTVTHSLPPIVTYRGSSRGVVKIQAIRNSGTSANQEKTGLASNTQ